MKKYDFLKNVNKKIKPGDDFFGYVNSNWIKKNPIPKDQAGWSVHHVLHKNNQDNLKELLDSLVEKNQKDEKLKKLRNFYLSGMDETTLKEQGTTKLQDLFSKIDAIKDKKSLIVTIAELHDIGVKVLWDNLVEPDDKDSTRYIFRLLQAGIALPDREYYLGQGKKSKHVREEYLKFLESFSAFLGRPMDKKQVSVVFKIETSLARASMTRVDSRDVEKVYNKTSFKKLKSVFSNIDWSFYFKKLGVQEGNLKELLINQPKFIEAVNKAFKDLSLEEWRLYLSWHTMIASAPYLEEKICKERFKFVGPVLTGAKIIRPRWKRVLDEVDHAMGFALGKLYVEKFFPEKARHKMDDMISDILSAYRERIQKLDWMTPGTKKKAIEKLSQINNKIGFPKKWETYKSLKVSQDSFLENHWEGNRFAHQKMLSKLGKPIDREEWHMTPSTVNAYYWANLNEIVFPAGILQPPSFDIDGSDAMNYGGVGCVIGHEITHGFDDEGSKFDGRGNLKRWWTKEDRSRFVSKTKKLIKQYDECEVLPGIFCNGKLTLGENIADLGGVTIAYNALQKRLKKSGNTKKVLGFSPEQQFFIAWAVEWCGSIRDELNRQYLITDPHSPYNLRVNMIVNNMDAFYQAFDIKPTDRLYRKPEDRVVIW